MSFVNICEKVDRVITASHFILCGVIITYKHISNFDIGVAKPHPRLNFNNDLGKLQFGLMYGWVITPQRTLYMIINPASEHMLTNTMLSGSHPLEGRIQQQPRGKSHQEIEIYFWLKQMSISYSWVHSNRHLADHHWQTGRTIAHFSEQGRRPWGHRWWRRCGYIQYSELHVADCGTDSGSTVLLDLLRGIPHHGHRLCCCQIIERSQDRHSSGRLPCWR